MNTLQLIATTLISCSLMACGGTGTVSSTLTSTQGSPSIVEKINGVVVPPDPGSAKDSTPEGVDTDKNGIRDEIDRMLAKKYGTKPELLQAMRMLFGADQESLQANPTNKIDALNIVYRAIDLGTCAGREIRRQGLKSSNAYDEAMIYTFNTRSRLDARKKIYEQAGMIMRNTKDTTIVCPYPNDIK